MEKKICKYNIAEILPIAITIIVIGLGITFGLDIMGDMQDDFITGAADCNSTTEIGCGADYNATRDASQAVSKFADKLGIIVTIIIAAILIGILVRYLMTR